MPPKDVSDEDWEHAQTIAEHSNYDVDPEELAAEIADTDPIHLEPGDVHDLDGPLQIEATDDSFIIYERTWLSRLYDALPFTS